MLNNFLFLDNNTLLFRDNNKLKILIPSKTTKLIKYEFEYFRNSFRKISQ